MKGVDYYGNQLLNRKVNVNVVNVGIKSFYQKQKIISSWTRSGLVQGSNAQLTELTRHVLVRGFLNWLMSWAPLDFLDLDDSTRINREVKKLSMPMLQHCQFCVNCENLVITFE